jgi:hypothetical protein
MKLRVLNELPLGSPLALWAGRNRPPPSRQGERVMRKALLLAVVALCAAAGAAHAQTHFPTFDAQYNCDYSAPWTNEVDPGWSIFTQKNPFPNIIYGIEVYKATTSTGQDNRKIAFAKPVDHCRFGDCENYPVLWTTWEFTIKDEIQCKSTRVSDFGRRITFGSCSNGKSRVCTR